MRNKKMMKKMTEFVNAKITEYIQEKQSENQLIDIKELRNLKKEWEKEFESQFVVA